MYIDFMLFAQQKNPQTNKLLPHVSGTWIDPGMKRLFDNNWIEMQKQICPQQAAWFEVSFVS